MRQAIVFSVMVLFFNFAPNRIITKDFGPTVERPGVNRSCTMPGERQACEADCASRSLITGNNGLPRLALVMTSCSVRTIEKKLTLVCTCGDPGLFTMNQTSEPEECL
jgi:hypothetical protein